MRKEEGVREVYKSECEYCKNGEICGSYEVFKQFPGKDCYIDLYMDRETRTNEYSLVVDHAVSCVIKYCPMCGRRLEEWEYGK